MSADEREFLLGIEVVSQWADELVGYEPTTLALNPDDPDDLEQFRRAARDADIAGSHIFAVLDPEGRVTIWRATHVHTLWPS